MEPLTSLLVGSVKLGSESVLIHSSTQSYSLPLGFTAGVYVLWILTSMCDDMKILSQYHTE